LKKAGFEIAVALLLANLITLSSAVCPVEPRGGFLLEMEASATVIIIGEEIDVTLNLTNLGEYAVTFTFTPPFFDLYCCNPEGCSIWSQGQYFIQVMLDLTLDPGESYTETLRWDLYTYVDGVFYPPEPGTYDLYGVAIYAGILTEPLLLNVIVPDWNPADFNDDLRVDIYDAVIICSAYDSTPQHPNWNIRCDIAEPYEIIDLYDVVTLCNEYGEAYNP